MRTGAWSHIAHEHITCETWPRRTIPGGPVDGARTVDPGDSFDVDVVIEDVIDFAGLQFVTFAEITVLGGMNITGPAVLATINFDAIGSGNSDLALNNAVLL